jgi:hypothetical protein
MILPQTLDNLKILQNFSCNFSLIFTGDLVYFDESAFQMWQGIYKYSAANAQLSLIYLSSFANDCMRKPVS